MHMAYGAPHGNARAAVRFTKRGSRIDICLDVKCLRQYIVVQVHMEVWRVLHQNHFHPYRFQKVQDLLPEDYTTQGSTLHAAARCRYSDVFSVAKQHSPLLDSSITTLCTAGKRRTLMKFIDSDTNIGFLSMCAGIVGDFLIGLYLIPSPLN